MIRFADVVIDTDTREVRRAEAVATLRRSIAITDDLENRWESAVTEDDLGNALAELGDLESADRSLRRCLDAAMINGNRYYVARCTGDLGAVAARRGDLDEAERLLEQARSMWEEIGHEPYLAWVTTQLARCGAPDPEGRERAVDRYASAMALATRNRLAPFVLEVVVGAAELGVPDPPVTRAVGLRCVARHPGGDGSGACACRCAAHGARRRRARVGRGHPVRLESGCRCGRCGPRVDVPQGRR